MDISSTTQPKSDQLNYDDVASIAAVITVTEVRAGTAEQPVEIHTAEYPGRPYKPNKSMRRVLVAAWGPESSTYTGRRIEVYGDPTVKWAGEPVGGIRIRSLSHIDKPMKVQLTTTRGKRSPATIQPLPDATPAAPVDVSEATDVDALRAAWQGADPDTRKAIEARVAELTKGAESDA